MRDVEGSPVPHPLCNAHFRALYLSQLLSGPGDWIGRLALTALVFDRSGSAAQAAAVTAVSLLPWLGLGQLLATTADRFGRFQLMVAANVVRGACFLAMAFVGHPAALLALAFLEGLWAPAFSAAQSAAIVDVVDDEQYPAAIKLAVVTSQAEIILGYLAGGLLLVAIGERGALVVNAASFAVGAVVLSPLLRSAAAVSRNTGLRAARRLRDGARSFTQDPLCRRALFLVSTTSVFGIMPEALVVPYAAEHAMPEQAAGVLAAMCAVGAIVGVALMPKLADHALLLRRSALVVLGPAGLTAAWFAFGPSGLAAFACFAIAGTVAGVGVPTNLVVGTRLPKDNRASAMAVGQGLLYGGQAVGAVGAGLLARSFGSATALTISGIGCVVAAALSAGPIEHVPEPALEEGLAA